MPFGWVILHWGLVYAFNTERSWVSDSFSTLAAFKDWTAGSGGPAVAKLPFRATLLDQPLQRSFYIPVSCLLWNEFYPDITEVAELQKCLPVQALLTPPSVQEKIDAWGCSAHVDWQRARALKRRILEELCRCLFAEAPDRLEHLLAWADSNISQSAGNISKCPY